MRVKAGVEGVRVKVAINGARFTDSIEFDLIFF